jgi:hypothetical protein
MFLKFNNTAVVVVVLYCTVVAGTVVGVINLIND